MSFLIQDFPLLLVLLILMLTFCSMYNVLILHLLDLVCISENVHQFLVIESVESFLVIYLLTSVACCIKILNSASASLVPNFSLKQNCVLLMFIPNFSVRWFMILRSSLRVWIIKHIIL